MGNDTCIGIGKLMALAIFIGGGGFEKVFIFQTHKLIKGFGGIYELVNGRVDKSGGRGPDHTLVAHARKPDKFCIPDMGNGFTQGRETAYHFFIQRGGLECSQYFGKFCIRPDIVGGKLGQEGFHFIRGYVSSLILLSQVNASAEFRMWQPIGAKAHICYS
jgi:hypothetical protein